MAYPMCKDLCRSLLLKHRLCFLDVFRLLVLELLMAIDFVCLWSKEFFYISHKSENRRFWTILTFKFSVMLKGILAALLVLIIGAGFGYLIGMQSREVGPIRLMWILVAQAFVLQIVAYIPAAALQTEMFYDLVGSLTFVSVTLVALVVNQVPDWNQLVGAGLIIVWSCRLGYFLFRRVLNHREDSRFAEIKKDKGQFLAVWVVQGLWCIFTSAPLLVLLSTNPQPTTMAFSLPFWIGGLVVWVTGFIVEAVSDFQKSTFNQDPANKGRFITTGLWAYSRHPNYFGQLVIWCGAALFAVPSLRDFGYFSLISPIFVYILLTRISGVPLLEKKADERWSKDPEYIAYKERTPAFIPCGPGDAPPQSDSEKLAVGDALS